MYKPRLYLTIFAVLFFIYWFVLLPLLAVYVKPVIFREDLFEKPFWTPAIFWCGALLIFVLLVTPLWCYMCYMKKKYTRTPGNNNGNLNSVTLHNGNDNIKNIKDRVQVCELKCKSDADAYQDIQTVFPRPNETKPISNIATQTSQTSENFGDVVASTPSPTYDFNINDPLRSSRRLSSCYSCSQSITDDDLVNVFLNKVWTKDDSDANGVKFEVVGKSVNQAKRFHIEEVDDISATQEEEKAIDDGFISIPVSQGKRIKSEIFIMINDDSTVEQPENGSDEVFE